MAYNFDKIKKEFGSFIRLYQRKTKNTCDPNDRGYDRKIEDKIKRMKPEELYDIMCDSIYGDTITNWPFDDSEDVAVFTSTQIINDRKPILYVSHDEEDGAWQFHFGEVLKIEEAMIVSLKEIYMIDASIKLLAKLPIGCYAKRKDINHDWEIFKKE